jgi:fatty-acyl-CoA synthase
MRALMMDMPLSISSLLEHAASVHGDRELVSCPADEVLHTSSYGEAAGRARRLVKVLRRLGVGPGDRVATLAWSTHRHFEIFYASSGMGAVCHTVNPRLPPEQIAWMLENAEDRLVFVDTAFMPVLEAALPHVRCVTDVVVMTDHRHMPSEATTSGVAARRCYEDLLQEESEEGFSWPRLDENAAAVLCYTSGTTGGPKGVLYSHRSQVLHAFAVALPDVGGFAEAETVLPAAPMFHVSAWGIPYAAALTGARLVLPGPRLQPAALAELIRDQRVTIALGVPTVWVGLIRYLRACRQRLDSLKRVIIGGAMAPASLIDALQREFGIEVRHAWGMTETSPLGTIGTLKAKHAQAPAEERLRLQAKQGRPVFGVEIGLVDEEGRPLPHDGRSMGEIRVRGPWVCSAYYTSCRLPVGDAETWFATGDVGTIDPENYLQITDRKKDLIKHAGEWISSVEIEELALQHPDALQAAVIGVPHEKWGERPVLFVALRPGSAASADDFLSLYAGRVAKWAVPHRVIILDSLPLGATGKVQKSKLRTWPGLDGETTI